MNFVKKYLHDILTEANNETFCPIRIIAIIGVLQYFAMAWAHYVQHGIFDAQNYAIGFGALLGGVGVALGLKKDTPK
jgi:hypothetical protein